VTFDLTTTAMVIATVSAAVPEAVAQASAAVLAGVDAIVVSQDGSTSADVAATIAAIRVDPSLSGVPVGAKCPDATNTADTTPAAFALDAGPPLRLVVGDESHTVIELDAGGASMGDQVAAMMAGERIFLATDIRSARRVHQPELGSRSSAAPTRCS